MSSWTEIYDEAYQKTYYYNSVTGETSWDVPADYYPPATSSDATSAGATSSGDWVPVYDEANQKYYYHNQATGETSWDPPANYSDPSSSSTADGQAVITEAPVQSTLPEQWTEMYDEGNQRYYYYNSATGETSWDMPVSIDLAQDAAYQANGNPSSNGVQWIEHYDDQGRVFYEHPETHETQWDSPYQPPSDALAMGNDECKY